ncbi:MAG: peptidoglycan-binding protein, partial [Chloroflexota bacterium]|nr:peptidoglycan-binding protein [Chloroflexota bacterium]
MYDAVKGFQKAYGLMVDGIVGPDTGDHLIGSTPNPYYCSKFVPTSYMVMDDSGNLAQGGQV